MNWDKLPDQKTIEATIAALKENGIEAQVAGDQERAKETVLSLVPEGSEIMTMSSVTVDQLGLSDVINNSGRYDSVKNKLSAMDRETQNHEMNQIGAAPTYSVGSVHAVTQDGKVLIASNTGSQLGAYAYGAGTVIWVVGTQKIVKNTDEGIKRIYDYVLPLESERLNKAYNLTTGSNVSKLLIVNKEIRPGRLHLIFVNQKIGF